MFSVSDQTHIPLGRMYTCALLSPYHYALQLAPSSLNTPPHFSREAAPPPTPSLHIHYLPPLFQEDFDTISEFHTQDLLELSALAQSHNDSPRVHEAFSRFTTSFSAFHIALLRATASLLQLSHTSHFLALLHGSLQAPSLVEELFLAEERLLLHAAALEHPEINQLLRIGVHEQLTLFFSTGTTLPQAPHFFTYHLHRISSPKES